MISEPRKMKQARSVRCARDPVSGDEMWNNNSKWLVTWRTVGGQIVDEFTVEAANRDEAKAAAMERCTWIDRGKAFRPSRLNIIRSLRYAL